VVQLARLELVVGKPTGRIDLAGDSLGGQIDGKLPDSMKIRGLPKAAPNADPKPDDDPLSSLRGYRKDYNSAKRGAEVIKDE